MILQGVVRTPTLSSSGSAYKTIGSSNNLHYVGVFARPDQTFSKMNLSPKWLGLSVRFKMVVLLLLIHYLLLLPLFAGVLWSLFCYAVESVLSSFAIILKRELVASLLLSS